MNRFLAQIALLSLTVTTLVGALLAAVGMWLLRHGWWIAGGLCLLTVVCIAAHMLLAWRQDRKT